MLKSSFAWPLSLLSTELSVHDLQALAPSHAEARTLAMALVNMCESVAACLNEFDDSSGKAYDCKAEEVGHHPEHDLSLDDSHITLEQEASQP